MTGLLVIVIGTTGIGVLALIAAWGVRRTEERFFTPERRAASPRGLARAEVERGTPARAPSARYAQPRRQVRG